MATFGYTTIGGTTIALGTGGSTSNVIGTAGAEGAAFTYTAAANGTITALNVYCNSASATPASVDVGIYTFNTTTKLPVALVGQATITFSNTSPAWNTTSVSIATTSGTSYTIVMGNYVNGSAASTFYRDVPAGTNNSQAAAGALPATWTPVTGSASLYSMYATYTENAGGSTKSRLPLLGVGV
jgi:hypothetical protein